MAPKNKESVLKNLVNKNPDDPIGEKLSEEQIDFVKAFNKLTEKEKVKLLESLTEEERQALFKLNDEFTKLRQKELEDALSEAKSLAIAKLRDKLALQKKLAYINFLKIESNMLKYAQQISRAFVFSYFDMLQWLESAF